MADKTGYIGRNPNDSAVTVARQFFTASGVTTAFTFASGYLTGYLDVYVDGVKKRVADEFTATDGSTFDVLQGGVGAGSTVEAVAYKAFNAAAVSGDITGNFDVSGNTTLGGSLGVTGGTTVTNLIVTGISTLGTGTTVGFANTAFNLGGTPNISVDLLSAVDINVSGAATIGGVLTYEDVTNIDSIGIVTARTGIEVTANGLVVNAGVGTFAADLSIADKLVHTGDTNTSIRFPSADTITAETAGVERLRIDSTGDVGLVGIATATGLVVVAGSGIYAGHTGIITAVAFAGNLTGAVTGNADTATTSTNVTVADESSDTTCFPLFATAATGNLPPKSGSNLTFNSSTGALTATSFAGALTGDVTGNATGLTGTPNIDCGTGSFTGDVDIADKIIHTGDTNTAIRFPAADTFTVETAGSEALRVDSVQRLLVGTTSVIGSGNDLFVLKGTAAADASFYLGRNANASSISNGNNLGFIKFGGGDGGEAARISGIADGTWSSTSDCPGRLTFSTTADGASSPTERLRIDSSGRLLQGKTATKGSTGENIPTFCNEIANTNNPNVFEIANNGTNASNSYSALVLSRSDGTSVNSHTAVDNGDKIGEVCFIGADGSDRFNTAASIHVLAEADFTANDCPANLIFSTNGGSAAVTERLRIDSGGRLLINTNTSRIVEDEAGNGPQGLIQIEGTNSDAIMSIISAGTADANRSGTLSLGRHRNGTIGGTPTIVQNGDSLGAICFAGGDGTDMRTKAAKILCEVDGTPGANDMPGRLIFSTTADGASSPTERLRITSAGHLSIVGDNQKLLIGAGDDLEIYHDGSHSYIKNATGNLYFQHGGENMAQFSSDGAVELYYDNSKKFETTSAGVTVTGDFTATGNVTAYSDVTLKENIETIPNALDKVLNLRGVEFDRIDKEDNTHEIGVIAQEVEEVIPEVVLTNTEGIKSVAYGNLVGLLIESIKELKAEVNNLKAQVEG